MNEAFESHTMAFVSSQTHIPVPIVRRYIHRSSSLWIFVEFIPGEDLKDIWESLSTLNKLPSSQLDVSANSTQVVDDGIGDLSLAVRSPLSRHLVKFVVPQRQPEHQRLLGVGVGLPSLGVGV